MSITIEEVAGRISAWHGKQIAIHPLAGGLTNSNYRVQVDDTSYVVRIPGQSTELLAVDRTNEHHNTRAAAAAGVGAGVVHYLADCTVMVLAFIPGETMSIAALQQPGMPARMAAAQKKLHAGPRFLKDFDMFRLTDFYLQIAAERGIRIPPNYPQRMKAVQQIERALAAKPSATVPCHNDLLAENYIDDGSQLWIVDYEYSGNNDPCFELGNTCQEQQFDTPRIEALCSAYFGSARPDKLARMQLNMIMSDVGWTLWAAIQASISGIDFDFWGWTVERWTRAETKMDSDEFSQWLRTAAQ